MALTVMATCVCSFALSERPACAIYAWLKRERLIDPSLVLWRGRSGMRSTTRHGAKGSDKGWAAKAQCISQRGDRANLRLERDHLECDTLWGVSAMSIACW